MVGTSSEVGGRWSWTCCWTEESLESGRSTSGVMASLRLVWSWGAESVWEGWECKCVCVCVCTHTHLQSRVQ